MAITEQAVHPNRVEFDGLGTTFLVHSARLSVVVHDLAPRTLGAPLHTHDREDECSYVLEGRLGVQLGDAVRTVGPGEAVLKPRGVPHAFWNPGDAPLRFVEVITPGAFAGYFADAAPLLPPQRPAPDLQALVATAARYGLALDLASTEALASRHGVHA